MAKDPQEEARKAIQARIQEAQKAIRKLLDEKGCPENTHPEVPTWELSADQEKWAYRFTGTIRVKVYGYRKTKMFVSNREGKFKDLAKIADHILSVYKRRVEEAERQGREQKRENELEPVAAQIRDEFPTVSEYGHLRVQATGRGLNLCIDVTADADQIRLLLLRAKELGMLPRQEGDEGPTERSTIFDRINEES